MTKAATVTKRAAALRSAKVLATAGAIPKIKRRVRMSRAVRRETLIEQAVEYFSAHGLNAQVKDFATAIGISEGLIFHYFGTKQQLLELVYDAAYQKSWPDDWKLCLTDRRKPISDRIELFYQRYFDKRDRSEWVLGALSTLIADPGSIARSDNKHVTHFLTVLHEEIRASYGLQATKMSELDRELMWHLHSTITTYLVRKYVLKTPVMRDQKTFVRRILSNFLCEFECNAVRAAA